MARAGRQHLKCMQNAATPLVDCVKSSSIAELGMDACLHADLLSGLLPSFKSPWSGATGRSTFIAAASFSFWPPEASRAGPLCRGPGTASELVQKGCLAAGASSLVLIEGAPCGWVSNHHMSDWSVICKQQAQALLAQPFSLLAAKLCKSLLALDSSSSFNYFGCAICCRSIGPFCCDATQLGAASKLLIQCTD